MKYLICDIETGPQDLETLQKQMPEFEAPSNFKDAEKIKNAIDAKKQRWIEEAALSAETGVLLAIGYKESWTDQLRTSLGPEKILLEEFWAYFKACVDHSMLLVGHNFCGFDWPFIIRRSWALGVAIHPSAYELSKFNSAPIFDTAVRWNVMGAKDYIGLDRLAKFLGVGEKVGSGADFAKLLATDKPKAIEYLNNDLELTEKVFLKMANIREEDDCPL